jgi:hypothetical protein
MEKTNSLLLGFNNLTDPITQKHSLRHKWIDILMLTIIAVICGADNWVAVEKFGRSKYEWLKTFFRSCSATLGSGKWFALMFRCCL